MRRDAKVDRNQGVVVAALRALNFKVQHTHTIGQGAPDFIVMGYDEDLRLSHLLWVELKCGRAGLTPDEQEWHDGWRAPQPHPPIIIAYCVRDILRHFGWLNSAIEAVLHNIKDGPAVKRALAEAKRKYGNDPDIAASLL